MAGRADDHALGARMHSQLAHGCHEAIAECFRRDDWTCHRCGFRLRQFMEVDHVRRHEPCAADELRTICQFCHNLRHPVWAAMRGRLRMIWAPALPQAALNRMAWLTLVSSADHQNRVADQELHAAGGAIIAAVRRRESIIASILGSSHPGGLFEAVFAVEPLSRPDRRRQAACRIEDAVRFWPVAAFRSQAKPDRPSASLSCWDGGCFVDIAPSAVAAFWRQEKSVEQFRQLCAAHLAEVHA